MSPVSRSVVFHMVVFAFTSVHRSSGIFTVCATMSRLLLFLGEGNVLLIVKQETHTLSLGKQKPGPIL